MFKENQATAKMGRSIGVRAVPIAARRSMMPAFLTLWEASVRATHLFLSEEDIAILRPEVMSTIETITHFYVGIESGQEESRQEGREGQQITLSEVRGFLGVEEDSIEMLFVDPNYFNQGFGSNLLELAVAKLGARYVDINEENGEAAEFYRLRGFEVFDRSDEDAYGNHYPILHLKLAGSGSEVFKRESTHQQ